ncbi:hypothetical protein CFC21_083388 [Triticum aestivum]|uniref:Senescence domain-containing protein n=4 Tax=Triticum TaxID=4564 RepID=A0A9R0TGT6_TRITD|nr:hypothetical protein TRIUR3_23363 [Triticum urartu]KAF7079090.1 hypothetical protein CFC21_083388 [Triticum aestivum]VAI12609.1 unnamed protein product [Triticum turgidum subsp. durum]
MPTCIRKPTDSQSLKAWSLSCSDDDNLGVRCKNCSSKCSTKLHDIQVQRFSVHCMAGYEWLADGVLGEVEAAAYWTAVAPNVEEYGSAVARSNASGAENVAKGIMWCGVMTVDRLRWRNEVLRKRIQTGDNEAEVCPEMLRCIKR